MTSPQRRQEQNRTATFAALAAIGAMKGLVIAPFPTEPAPAAALRADLALAR